MTRIGGSHGHYRVGREPSEHPDVPSLSKLPSELPHTQAVHIPLSDLSKLILPEAIQASTLNEKSQKAINALLAMVALNGLKDGVNGSS